MHKIHDEQITNILNKGQCWDEPYWITSKTMYTLHTRSSPSWITALSWWRGLCNSMKLWAMLHRVIQDGWVIVKSSDKMWSTGERNGKPLQYSCYENPMNSMKKQKNMTLDKSPQVRRWNMLLGNSREQLLIAPERKRQLGQSRNNPQLWLFLMVKVQWFTKE